MTGSGNLADILELRPGGCDPLVVEVAPDGRERAVSTREFRDLVDAVARGLLKAGLRRGQSIGILAENGADYLAAYMGIMRAGLVAVPVSHKLPAEVIRHILADSACRLVFADAQRRALVPEGLPVVEIDAAGPGGWIRFLDPGPFAAAPCGPADVAMILYTSGSTGMPKGVPLTHAGYLWATAGYDALRPAFEAKATIIAAPLFHMNGLFSSKLLMRLGGTNILMTRFQAQAYLRAIHRHRCTALLAVPTMLALIARESAVLKEVDLTSIRQILVGSAPSSDALIEEIRRMFPNAALINSWGTTEAGPLCFGPHPKGLPRPPLSLGYPRPDVQVRLAGGPSPDEGVLQLRTPALMNGYLNRPEESAQRLKDGWYDTGDVMRRDADGFFWFVGRQDDMFICGGENIYPAEVEKLLESHPEIAQAAVVPVADAIKGQVPVAFVVRTPGSALDEEGVKQYALQRGPAYAHPRRVAFLSELPLAGTNKIDRKRLAQDAAAFAAARIGRTSTGGPRA